MLGEDKGWKKTLSLGRCGRHNPWAKRRWQSPSGAVSRQGHLGNIPPAATGMRISLPVADPNPAQPRLPPARARPRPEGRSPLSPGVPRHSLYLAVTPRSCPAGRCSPPCQETPRRGFCPPQQGDTWGVTLGLPAPGDLRGHLPLSQVLAHFPASPAWTVCCCSLPCHSGRVIPL